MTAPMTVTEWKALTVDERKLLWRTWTVEQRRDMVEQFIAYSPTWALRYPNDYGQPADSPVALQMLALDTDTALTNVLAWPSAYRGYYRNVDVGLAADTLQAITWSYTNPLPAGTIASVQSNGSVQTAQVTGLMHVEIHCAVYHPTPAREAVIQVMMNRTAGSQVAQLSRQAGVRQIGSDASHVSFIETIHMATGDTYRCEIRPLGAASTGWVLSYARHVMTRIK